MVRYIQLRVLQKEDKVVFPFEREAARGEPMPDGLSLPNQMAYQTLCAIYARIRLGTISRQQAEKEKGAMLYLYDKGTRDEAFQRKLTVWQVDLFHAIEAAQSNYRKNRTLENADRLSAVLDGRL